MGDFFSGLSLGDQLELGTASLSSGVDPETWNMMLRQEMDAQALAKQVQKHGPGHGRDAVAQASSEGESERTVPAHRHPVDGQPWQAGQSYQTKAPVKPKGCTGSLLRIPSMKQAQAVNIRAYCRD